MQKHDLPRRAAVHQVLLRETKLFVGRRFKVIVQREQVHRTVIERVPQLLSGQMEIRQVIRPIFFMVANHRKERHLVDDIRHRLKEFARPQCVILPAHHEVAGMQNKVRLVLPETIRQLRVDIGEAAGIAIGDELRFPGARIERLELIHRVLQSGKVHPVRIRLPRLQIRERRLINIKYISAADGVRSAGTAAAA